MAMDCPRLTRDAKARLKRAGCKSQSARTWYSHRDAIIVVYMSSDTGSESSYLRLLPLCRGKSGPPTTRGWLQPEAYEAAEAAARKAAVDLLTGGLTFPYTLASVGQRFGGGAGQPVRICVVGARAEASMPLPMWREALCLAGWSALRVDMVGPKVSETKARDDDRGVSVVPEAALFHESALHRAHLSGSELPDAFVLFNPGLGEPGWDRAWAPTVHALLALRRPVLLTALSASDAEQDAAFWSVAAAREGHAARAGLEYAANPWSSLLAADVRGNDEPGASNSLITLNAPSDADGL